MNCRKLKVCVAVGLASVCQLAAAAEKKPPVASKWEKFMLHFNAEGSKLLAERARADVEQAYPAK